MATDIDMVANDRPARLGARPYGANMMQRTVRTDLGVTMHPYGAAMGNDQSGPDFGARMQVHQGDDVRNFLKITRDNLNGLPCPSGPGHLTDPLQTVNR